ncbi:MAG: hypothetical protein U1C33_02340, partial [Candidatus Cloacimonadaceae bacterium]|nr:hypothetical protein [Candidatus Cloacimonadaceae bacterium]
LSLDSKWGKNGAAHNFGAYYTRFLVKQKDSVWLHSELIWQRYNITYNFSGRTINTDNLLLANAFADTLSGSIDTTVDYITIPVLIKLRQELAERPDRHYEGAFIYFGPAFSLAINSNTTKHKGISALDQNVSSFVAESYTDSDPSTVYSARERTSGTGKVLAHKTDFVLGLGFHIKDILELGLGRDEYVIDCRLTGGLYPIGDGDSKTEFKLRSVVLSLGVRI